MTPGAAQLQPNLAKPLCFRWRGAGREQPAGSLTSWFPIPCLHHPEPSGAGTLGSQGWLWHQIKANNEHFLYCKLGTFELTLRVSPSRSNDCSELSAASMCLRDTSSSSGRRLGAFLARLRHLMQHSCRENTGSL